MNGWSKEQLDALGTAEELELASRRPDGSLRPFVTMWVVAVGGDVYVRSAGGPDRLWYRHALASSAGRIRAGGIDADVTFAESADPPHAAIDEAYHAKYDHYGRRIVVSVVGPEARRVTIRVTPSRPHQP